MKGWGVIGSLARNIRKKCIHEGKEGVKEQYSLANTIVMFRDMDMK